MTTTGPINGSLLIHGGTTKGQLDQDTIDQFVALAGRRGANIVYIPTAEKQSKITAEDGVIGKFHGLNFTVSHTRNRRTANQDSFVNPIRNATGVFIDGGRQPRLAKPYLNTRTQNELEDLLERGGVIAGTSAGATILGSFLVRNQGTPRYDYRVMVYPNHPTEGFGFIKNIAIDQHISERSQDNDLVAVVNSHPELLGIGIDEDTAIHVQGDQFTVIGIGKVYVHDGTHPWYTLNRGDKFDLPSRQTL